MTFDADLLLRAFDMNAQIAMPADVIDPLPDQPEGVHGAAILSAGALAAAADLGLSEEETRSLAEVCNRMVLAPNADQADMDQQQATCAVGQFWGYLACLRVKELEQAEAGR